MISLCAVSCLNGPSLTLCVSELKRENTIGATKMNINLNKIKKMARISIVMAALVPILLSGCSGGGGGSKEPKPSPIPAPIPAPPVQGGTQCAGESLLTGNECLTVNDRDTVLYRSGTQVPDGIALFLHGSPGDANKVMGIFDAQMIAQKYNLVALSPHGTTSTWGWLSLNTPINDNADTQYLDEVLIKVRGDYGITSDKLYVFGYSAGGFMAYKLACTMPEQVSAVIALAGQYRGSLENCPTSTAVNIHHLHSVTDTEVPFGGRNTGNILSVEQTIEHWRQKNGCGETFETIEQAGVTESSPGTTTELYASCDKTVTLSKMASVAHESNYMADKLLDIYGHLLKTE
jgi:polyhydroxybutyrate depolymerase